jgi:hypothetical protein
VSQGELVEFLSAADVCITPYLNPAQITSGTLAYAVGAGRAVISTPYLYAQELLADGRGVLVPWRDPEAITRAVVDLLSDDAKRLALCERARAYGETMQWPVVARRYVEVFDQARTEHAQRQRTAFRAKTLAQRPAALPEIELAHVEVLSDQTGILQHATFAVPRYEDGYCLDDNARALLLMTLLEESGSADSKTVRALASRYLAFVAHAFDRAGGRFRNFMSYARQWLEDRGSEDSHGRAVWALGTVVGRSSLPAKRSLAGELFHAALPAITDFTSPRAWSYALLGIDEYLRAFQGDSNVQAVGTALAERLLGLFRQNSTGSWPWFEDRLTHSNARLPQAMLVSGLWLNHEEMVVAGTRSLQWLIDIQRSDEGDFAPIGSDGFYQRGGRKALFDQHPVEACAMVSACLEVGRMSGELVWMQHARRAFGWFLGQNHLQQPLYDATTGGCRDGLHADRRNENQGAESTLSFLLALSEMRSTGRTIPPFRATA